jgi:hypothetical protein
MIHGQNLSSTSGEPEFVAEKFFEIPASAQLRTVDTGGHMHGTEVEFKNVQFRWSFILKVLKVLRGGGGE